MKENGKKIKLYNAWVKLFSKYWVKKVSIDMIVKEAWVAKGTFYLYFKNKEELYETIIQNTFDGWKIQMERVVNKYPNVKLRILYEMVWSLVFFQKHDIFRNIVMWNEDYCCWNINSEYLKNQHLKLLEIVLSDIEMEDSKKIEFLSKIMWFFNHLNFMKCCFPKDEEFMEFAVQIAAVLVEWFFWEHDKLASSFNHEEFEKEVINFNNI